MKVKPSGTSFYFLATAGRMGRYSRRFPLSEEGWTQAWQAFRSEDPEAADVYLASRDPGRASPRPTSSTGESTGSPHTATGRAGDSEAHADAAAELAELKANIAREAAAQRAKYTGWKPLTIWYTFWGSLLAVGSLSALFSGSVGVFFIGVVISGVIGLYVKYLYDGGTRRVWFVFF